MSQHNKGTGQREVISNVWKGKGSTEPVHTLWGQVWSGWSLRQDLRARHLGRGNIQCKGPEVRESSLLQKWKGVIVARVCWMREGKENQAHERKEWEREQKRNNWKWKGGKEAFSHFPRGGLQRRAEQGGKKVRCPYRPLYGNRKGIRYLRR